MTDKQEERLEDIRKYYPKNEKTGDGKLAHTQFLISIIDELKEVLEKPKQRLWEQAKNLDGKLEGAITTKEQLKAKLKQAEKALEYYDVEINWINVAAKALKSIRGDQDE